MKHKFFALLLSACLLLAVLASCTTADNDVPTNDIPINDVPTPDTAEPEIDATIDGSDPEEGVTPEPITPIEPIEDYQLPPLYEGRIMHVFSMEDMFHLMESMPYLSENSTAYTDLQAAGFQTPTEYYVPNPEKIPQGYELIMIRITPAGMVFCYSSTPEEYQEFPWYWPEETSLHYNIKYEWLHTYNQISINGDRVDATDLVITYKIGDNDHVLQ
ncbi:MAG: hypothetical protein IJW40_00465 [Clostridia bacterium]|nr:hypothetical protein [Clostridia bacterium]